jgi:hypothetical protein
LPASRGFVELKTETVAQSKSGRKERSKSRVIAYFYQPDATSAMSPAPSDAKVALGGKVISLSPQSSEPAQFASEPGDYPDALRGQIDLQLDGKALQARFSFR